MNNYGIDNIPIKGKLIREINNYFVYKYEYDERGNCIYQGRYAVLNHTEVRHVWRDYDDNNREIHRKVADNRSERWEWWKEYDERGNCICYKDSRAEVIRYTYDDKNRIISIVNNMGLIEKYSYLADGSITYYENNDGRYRWRASDSKGNMIFEKSKERFITVGYLYDENGNIIEKIDNNNNIELFEYDEYGRKIKHSAFFNGVKKIFEDEFDYDENGNMIYSKSSGVETIYIYNDHGDLIHLKSSTGFDMIREFSYD